MTKECVMTCLMLRDFVNIQMWRKVMFRTSRFGKIQRFKNVVLHYSTSKVNMGKLYNLLHAFI